jgi:hypothetical protein
MKKIPLIICAFLFTINISRCLAWGAFGHELVGDIAKVYVKKSVADSVQKYLGDMTWAKAAVWMDEIRSDHSFDNFKPLHYINIDEGKEYEDTNEVNIINGLIRLIRELKEDRSKLSPDTINMELKILFHLMGDLHQPLHVGYGIDKGGNTVEVYTLIKTTNLHSAWDTEIIENDKTFKSELIAMSKKLTNEEIKKQKRVDVIAWMNESRSFLPQVYDFKKSNIDEAYVAKNIPLMEKQILYAGIRLAGVLNFIFM